MRWLTRTDPDVPAPERKPARHKPVKRRRAPQTPRKWLRALAVLLLFALPAGAATGWWASGGMARSWTWAKAEFRTEAARLSGVAGFAVGEVLVEGRTRTSPEAVARAIGTRPGAPILALDLDAAKARLEALPWIKRAGVKRRLPGTLHVRLDERRPLALWQLDRKLKLIDEEGTVIAVPADNGFAALPVVVGPDAAENAAALIAMLAEQPTLAPLVKAAVRVGGRRWNLRLRGGIEVRLPETGAAAAWRRLAQAERRHRLLARDVLVIDLRLADRMIVRTRAPARRTPPARRPRAVEKST